MSVMVDYREDIAPHTDSTDPDLRSVMMRLMKEMYFNTSDLTEFMKSMGDQRDYSTIMRSIQRMLSGEVKVSGEMIVILHMLLGQRLRLKERYPDIEWEVQPDQRHIAHVDNYKIVLIPERKKWKIDCRRVGDKHSLTWERFSHSIEEAKYRCLSYIEAREIEDALLHSEVAI